MKLLLTSVGLGHKSFGTMLAELVGKPASEIKIGFVPTPANVEPRKKDWLINELLELWRYGYCWIDIVDFSAAGVDWKARLSEVDVIYLPGGDPYHLLSQMRETGFADWLADALKTKVYVGSSASAMVMGPTIVITEAVYGYAGEFKAVDPTGLGYVDFEIAPHCDMSTFVSVEAYAKTAQNPVYAIDDLTIVRVVDGEVTVLSKGSWKLYKPAERAE